MIRAAGSEDGMKDDGFLSSFNVTAFGPDRYYSGSAEQIGEMICGDIKGIKCHVDTQYGKKIECPALIGKQELYVYWDWE